jgi:hypothetical protein
MAHFRGERKEKIVISLTTSCGSELLDASIEDMIACGALI